MTDDKRTVEVKITIGPDWFLGGVLVVLGMSLVLGWLVLTT